jgi:hypothetical protein
MAFARMDSLIKSENDRKIVGARFSRPLWIPASAGMTDKRCRRCSPAGGTGGVPQIFKSRAKMKNTFASDKRQRIWIARSSRTMTRIKEIEL